MALYDLLLESLGDILPNKNVFLTNDIGSFTNRCNAMCRSRPDHPICMSPKFATSAQRAAEKMCRIDPDRHKLLFDTAMADAMERRLVMRTLTESSRTPKYYIQENNFKRWRTEHMIRIPSSVRAMSDPYWAQSAELQAVITSAKIGKVPETVEGVKNFCDVKCVSSSLACGFCQTVNDPKEGKAFAINYRSLINYYEREKRSIECINQQCTIYGGK